MPNQYAPRYTIRNGIQRHFEAWWFIRRSLAFSEDGISWTKHPGNPVITSDDFPVSGQTWDTALIYQDGVYRYYMEIGTL